MIEALLNKIESYGFECQGGPLILCQDWMKLRVEILLRAAPITGEPVAGYTPELVEERLHAWRQRQMNRSGDRLSLEDCLQKETIDDLIDYVCAPVRTAPITGETSRDVAAEGGKAMSAPGSFAMKPELLPCPFCGAGESQFREHGKQWLGMKYSEPASVSVQHWCDPVAGQPNRMIERVGRDKDSAIEAWNRRAAVVEPPLRSFADALDDALSVAASTVSNESHLSTRNTFLCPYCGKPAVGWTEADAKRGNRQAQGGIEFHCRSAAD